MTSFGYIIPCPFTLLHLLLPTLYSKLGFDNWCTYVRTFDNWCTRTYVDLLLLAYTRFWICFQSFQNFSSSYNFILFKNLLLHIWPLIYLFLLERDSFYTVYICFKEILFFIQIFNTSPYLRALAANLGCQ